MNDLLLLLAACISLAACIVWNTPQMLRWCIIRLSMREAYIVSGREASAAMREQMTRQEVEA
jgi:hypothetical protein